MARNLQPIETRYLDDDVAERLYRDHPDLGRSPDTYCPTCDKVGHYFWKGEERPCDCAAQLQLHKHYLLSGIGVDYQRMSWDDFQGDPELKAVVDLYLDGHSNFVNRGVGLLISGTFGTGKTFASMMLLKDLVKLGYSCYATTFASMIEMFTAGWRSDEDRRFFQEKVVYSQVLLLDDLGKEMRRKNNLAESTFDDVLRRRHSDGRPTLITTNFTKRELSEGYGGAILSLLREKSITHEATGTDFRPQANDRMIREIKAGEFRPIF